MTIIIDPNETSKQYLDDFVTFFETEMSSCANTDKKLLAYVVDLLKERSFTADITVANPHTNELEITKKQRRLIGWEDGRYYLNIAFWDNLKLTVEKLDDGVTDMKLELNPIGLGLLTNSFIYKDFAANSFNLDYVVTLSGNQTKVNSATDYYLMKIKRYDPTTGSTTVVNSQTVTGTFNLAGDETIFELAFDGLLEDRWCVFEGVLEYHKTNWTVKTIARSYYTAPSHVQIITTSEE